MQSPRLLTLATSIALVAGLSACASVDPYGPNNYPSSSVTPMQRAPSNYVEYGRITNVSMINPGRGSGNTTAGTVAGAVVGGILGNQVGGGSGRTLATILGAVGGAAVGSQIQANQNAQYNTAGPVHRVSVTTDQGVIREYDVSASSDLRIGDRVRIENGVIYLG